MKKLLVYAGVRLYKEKRIYTYHPVDEEMRPILDKESNFKRIMQPGGAAIGLIYEFDVDDSNGLFTIGAKAIQRIEDENLIVEWQVQSRAAESYFARVKAAKADLFEKTLAPIKKAYRFAPNRRAKSLILARVIEEIIR